MVLLAEGRVTRNGRPDEVLTPSVLEEAFEWPIAVADLGDLGRHAIARHSSVGDPDR
jgi:ABC-type hemin transport system ATPase subunit